jgi:phage/plasmid-like protein (TIGR03299 family)
MIEMVDGKASMAYAGETPWHGLGKRVPADLTPDQMLEAAGLNWEVKKYKSSARVGDKYVQTGQSALVRTSDNKVLDIVSNAWEPTQNSEAFDFFAEFVAAGTMEMHTAGSLREGQVVWALAKTTESFEVLGKDQVEGYLLFTNPHQFGWAMDIRFTPIRVVCNNTLVMSLSQKSDSFIRVSHRRKFDAERVKEVLGLTHTRMDEYKASAEFLASKRYTVESLKEYFQTAFPLSRPKEDTKRELSIWAKRATEVVDTQPGADLAPGTFWNAYNAVSFLIDHEMCRDQDTRLFNAWYGGTRKMKAAALQSAVKIAAAA